MLSTVQICIFVSFGEETYELRLKDSKTSATRLCSLHTHPLSKHTPCVPFNGTTFGISLSHHDHPPSSVPFFSDRRPTSFCQTATTRLSIPSSSPHMHEPYARSRQVFLLFLHSFVLDFQCGIIRLSFLVITNHRFELCIDVGKLRSKLSMSLRELLLLLEVVVSLAQCLSQLRGL